MVVKKLLVSARVYQEPPGWDLVSVSPECCTAQCLLRMSRIPYEVLSGYSPGRSSLVVELFLAGGDVVVCEGLGELLRGMPKAGVDVDARLTAAQKAESAAFRALIAEADLARAWEWWWVSKTFHAGVRDIYAAQFRFPLSYLYPRWKRAEECRALNRQLEEADLLRMAEEAYVSVEARLGHRDWFFGDQPTSIDAYIFGFFGAGVGGVIPNGKLHKLLPEFRKVNELVTRLEGLYFVDHDPSEGFIRPVPKPGPPKHPSRTPEEEKSYRNSQLILAGMASVFFGYILVQQDVELDTYET